MNKPQLVSFFMYRRQSRDRFRIIHLYITVYSWTYSTQRTCLLQ